MDVELRTRYWDDKSSRTAFKSFIKEIHNLDFTAWESEGFWDSAYTPFSFFYEGKVISSVCLYFLDAIIDSNPTKLIQISGVGTSESWRRKGLNQELTQIGLGWAKDKYSGLFLFADEDAIPYYKHCGFVPLQECLHEISVDPLPKISGAFTLDPTNPEDLKKVYNAAQFRTGISDKFSILNPKLLMFHALYTMRNNMVEIPDLGCVIFLNVYDDCISIYDIIGESIPDFRDIYPYVSSESCTRVEFHFETDKLGLGEVRSIPITSNHPFTKGPFPVKKPVFPFTSRA